MSRKADIEEAVRKHIEAGGHPLTPPEGISSADLDWIGWGITEGERFAATLEAKFVPSRYIDYAGAELINARKA